MSILGNIGSAVGQSVKELADRIDAIDGANPETDQYKQLDYNTDGVLASIKVYSDVTKHNLVSQKDFSYTDGKLTQVASYTSGSLYVTTTLTYNSDDVLVNIAKDYA